MCLNPSRSKNATARDRWCRWQLAMARSTGLGPYYSNRELSAARALQDELLGPP